MAHTEEMLIHGIMTPVSVFDSSAQEIDDTVRKIKQGAAGVGAVALDGSNAMMAPLYLYANKSPTPALITTYENGDALFGAEGVDQFAYVKTLVTRSDLASVLQLVTNATGSYSEYNIFHTGNKPSGSYTGNGSATARTINIGGVGEALYVDADGSIFIVGYWGAIGVYGASADGQVRTLSATKAKFRNGVLTLTTSGDDINNNGVTYKYRVL